VEDSLEQVSVVDFQEAQEDLFNPPGFLEDQWEVFRKDSEVVDAVIGAKVLKDKRIAARLRTSLLPIPWLPSSTSLASAPQCVLSVLSGHTSGHRKRAPNTAIASTLTGAASIGASVNTSASRRCTNQYTR
jgi:hypothetical protein